MNQIWSPADYHI